jgi:L-alanine-DL-glutamate epimerase-like enolase superfamily enzyme
MAITAGEYGYDLPYFERMLAAGAVDVLQADGTRCGGITGLLRAEALCEARGIDFSAHCAPSLHLHPACALPRMRHIEFFHDHDRIERLLFEGAVEPKQGKLAPDLTRPGHGLSLRKKEAQRFAL